MTTGLIFGQAHILTFNDVMKKVKQSPTLTVLLVPFTAYKQRTTIVLAVIFAACQISVAAPHVFQDHNFAIEFPSNWQIINPPAAPIVAAAQSPDGGKSVLASAIKVPKGEISTCVRDMASGAKRNAIDKGWQITDEQETSIGGMPFLQFTIQISTNASIITYVGLAGDECYMLQGISKRSDASSDAEMVAALKSFRVLSPRNIPVESNRPKSAAYRAGYVLGQLMCLALVIAGAVWLIRRVKTTKVK